MKTDQLARTLLEDGLDTCQHWATRCTRLAIRIDQPLPETRQALMDLGEHIQKTLTIFSIEMEG